MLKQKLIDLGDAVMDGSAHRGDAAVAAQCYGIAIKAVEAGVKVREFEEIALPEFREVVCRIELLEELQSTRRGTGWSG